MACLPAPSPADAACAPASPATGRGGDPAMLPAPRRPGPPLYLAWLPPLPFLSSFPSRPRSAPRPRRRPPRPRAAPRRGASPPAAARGSPAAARRTGAAPLGGGGHPPAHCTGRGEGGRRSGGARCPLLCSPPAAAAGRRCPGRAGVELGGVGRERRGPRHRPWGRGGGGARRVAGAATGEGKAAGRGLPPPR